MERTTLDGLCIMDIPEYRDRLLRLQGEVMAGAHPLPSALALSFSHAPAYCAAPASSIPSAPHSACSASPLRS